MPKLKTHSGTAKRFKITGTGKIVMKKAGKRHLLTKKSSAKKRGLGDVLVDPSYERHVKRLMPYQ